MYSIRIIRICGFHRSVCDDSGNNLLAIIYISPVLGTWVRITQRALAATDNSYIAFTVKEISDET